MVLWAKILDSLIRELWKWEPEHEYLLIFVWYIIIHSYISEKGILYIYLFDTASDLSVFVSFIGSQYSIKLKCLYFLLACAAPFGNANNSICIFLCQLTWLIQSSICIWFNLSRLVKLALLVLQRPRVFTNPCELHNKISYPSIYILYSCWSNQNIH